MPFQNSILQGSIWFNIEVFDAWEYLCARYCYEATGKTRRVDAGLLVLLPWPTLELIDQPFFCWVSVPICPVLLIVTSSIYHQLPDRTCPQAQHACSMLMQMQSIILWYPLGWTGWRDCWKNHEITRFIEAFTWVTSKWCPDWQWKSPCDHSQCWRFQANHEFTVREKQKCGGTEYVWW